LRSNPKGAISAVRAEQASSLQVRNCQFLGDWYAGVDWKAVPEAPAVIANCLFLTRHHAVNSNIPQDAPAASSQVLNNTLVSRAGAVAIQIGLPKVPEPASGLTAARLEARRNVYGFGFLDVMYFAGSKEADEFLEREHRSLARRFVPVEDRSSLM